MTDRRPLHPNEIPPTAIRVALQIAVGTKHGELTEGEHKMVVAVADFFASDWHKTHTEVEELRQNLNHMADKLLELHRQIA